MKKILLFVLCFNIALLSSCGKTYTYSEMKSGSSIQEIKQSLGKDPAKETTDKNGNEFITYEDCPYLGYKGTSTYCFSDDKMQFSKWEYKNEDASKAKEVYDKIVDEKQKKYGTGKDTQSEGVYMCNWNEGTNSIALTCITNEDTTVVTLTEIISANVGK